MVNLGLQGRSGSRRRVALAGHRLGNRGPRAATKRRTVRPLYYRLITLGSLIVVLALWQIIGARINPIFLSTPTKIARATGTMISDGSLLPAFAASIKPMLLGYVIAAIVGIPVGLAIGRSRAVEAAIGFFVLAGYAMPLVALIPLFVLWFGLHTEVKVVVVATMSVFPIIMNTWAGAQAVEKTLVEVGRAFGVKPHGIIRKIVLPASVPFIMAGLRLGVGRAVIGIVIAEFFTAISGLGGLVINAGQRFDTASMFVPIIVLMLLGIGLTRLVGYIEKKVAPWQTELTKQ